MPDMPATPVSSDVVQSVEQYVYRELADAKKYDNRAPLDESGIFSLHRLVAEAYARGWDDGERVAVQKERGRRDRERDRDATG